MNRIIRSVCLALLVATGVAAKAGAQTSVRRYDATKSNDYGVVYRLPITQVEVGFVVATEEFIPGSLAPYAQRFIGESSQTEPKKSYTIEKVFLSPYGVPDENAEFVATFKNNRTMSYLTLTQDGILHSVNGEHNGVIVLRDNQKDYALGAASIQPPLPSDQIPQLVTPVLPKEYSLATSELKRAEIAADRLFDIKEDLLSLVSGRVESMPQDGRAMDTAVKKLEEQIAAIEALFKGQTKITYSYHTIRFIPEYEDKNLIVARFSPEYGITDPDDLSGYPLQLSYRVTDVAPLLTEKEQKRLEKKLDGLVYRLPGRAEITISYMQKELIKKEIPIAQLGSLQPLTSKIEIFDNEQIYFDTSTGAYMGTISPYIAEEEIVENSEEN